MDAVMRPKAPGVDRNLKEFPSHHNLQALRLETPDTFIRCLRNLEIAPAEEALSSQTSELLSVGSNDQPIARQQST